MVRDRVPVTMSGWEAELRSLRANLGSTVSMRLRWRWKTSPRPSPSGAGFEVMFGDGIDQTLTLALYAESAQPGDRAVVEVEVEENPNITGVQQGRVVDVAGRPAPGHAAVVIVDGDEYWPIYPCSLTVRTPRL